MNSPIEPASPTTSVSSGSPPPEDSAPGDENLFAQASHPSAGKRRLGSGTFASGPSTRAQKSSRREEVGLAARRSGWEGREGMRSQKDELVDHALVEQLRAQFGDPFDDDIIKQAS